MRVLLTGGTGLIGQQLGRALVAAGHELVVLTRSPERARSQMSFPCELFGWRDVSTPPPAQALKVDAVVHLAGDTVAERWTDEKKREIRHSRVASTKALVQAANTSAQIQTFILGSAIGWYGDTGEQLATENDESAKDFLATVVKEWEGALDELQPRIRSVAIRTGVVLAAEGGALEKMKAPFHAGVGGALGSGQAWLSWIHIFDLIRLFSWALTEKKLSGPLNAVAPEVIRNQGFSETLANVLGKKLFLPVPSLMLKLALGEMSQIVLSSARISSAKAVALGFDFQFPHLKEALKDLLSDESEGRHQAIYYQWVPKPVEEVFPFFSSETNLEDLTPPFLNFKVLNKSTPTIQEGTEINYRLQMYGIPFPWKTRITQWQPGLGFVDEQKKGPYNLWHHTHTFSKLGAGTLLKDRILFRLPMGLVGDLVAGWKVRQDVRNIFAFRRAEIARRFGTVSVASDK